MTITFAFTTTRNFHVWHGLCAALKIMLSGTTDTLIFFSYNRFFHFVFHKTKKNPFFFFIFLDSFSFFFLCVFFGQNYFSFLNNKNNEQKIKYTTKNAYTSTGKKVTEKSGSSRTTRLLCVCVCVCINEVK